MGLINLDIVEENEKKLAEVQFLLEDALALVKKLEMLQMDGYDFHVEKALMNMRSAIFNIESFLKGKSVE